MVIKCECEVGPGRYEGEEAETPILESISEDAADEEEASGQGTAWQALVLKPGNHATKEDYERALEAGFCAGCVQKAAADINNAAAARVGSDSQGFIWSVLYDNEEEARKDFYAYFPGGPDAGE